MRNDKKIKNNFIDKKIEINICFNKRSKSKVFTSTPSSLLLVVEEENIMIFAVVLREDVE